MKRILSFIFTLIPFLVTAQPYVYPPTGVPKGLNTYAGALKINSSLIFPRMDSATNSVGVKSDVFINRDSTLIFRNPLNGIETPLAGSSFTGTFIQAKQSKAKYDFINLTDYGGGILVRSDTVTTDVESMQFVTAGGHGYVRKYNKGELFISWFGAKPDWNFTTKTGTDNTPAFNKAIQYLLAHGGGEVLGESGDYYITPGIFINSNYQIPITIAGYAGNLSYSDADTFTKGMTLHMTAPGNYFTVGLDADGNRFYTSPTFLYKSFSMRNISFIGENVTLGINAVRTFYARTYMRNVSATKIDYLVLQSDTDNIGNQNYCDGSVYEQIKIYQSRKGGLQLNRSDATSLRTIIAEVGTNTTENIIDLKSGSGISISGFILGGNATIPALIPGSSMISINNCTNVNLQELHIERPYFESVIYSFGNSRNIRISGLYTKFETNYVLKFSGQVKTVHVDRWFSAFSDGPNVGYTDINAVNTSTDDIQLSGLNLLMADNVTSRDVTVSGAAMNTTQSNTNNILTQEKLNFPKAFNELVRGLAYGKGQVALNGGGTISYDASGNLKWSDRFFASAVDKINGSSGFVQMFMPANGTVIAGLGTTPSVTVTSAGIPFNSTWNFLVAEHTTGTLGTTVVYKIGVFGTQGTNTLLPNQILIAARNSDDGSIKLGTGATIQPGGSITKGRTIAKQVIQETVQTDVTIQPGTTTLICNKGGQVNGVNRVITLQAVALSTEILTIYNYNSGAQNYSTNLPLTDKTGSTITALPNQSVIQIASDGTVYRVINIY